MVIVLQYHSQIFVSHEFHDSPDIDARSNGLCNKSMAQVIRTNPSLYTRTEERSMPSAVNAFYGFSSIMYDRCNPLCSIDLLPCLQFLHEGLPNWNIPDRLRLVLLGGA